jgi:hypothetical protein
MPLSLSFLIENTYFWNPSERQATYYMEYFTEFFFVSIDRLCGLIVKIPGYRSRDLG